MQDDDQLETGPEIIKPDMAEAEKRYDEWTSAMASEDVPAFAGEDATFSTPDVAQTSDFAPTPGLASAPETADPSAAGENNEGIADAAALINYGLDAAARKYGVEMVVQGIKTFDAAGSSDPVKALYRHLGIDTAEEVKEVRDENAANQPATAEFRDEIGIAGAPNRSNEGALQAVADMKELIAEVEGADPRYEDLRQGAKAAGKGYFEYAVESFGRQGLVELFGVLKEQRKQKDSEDTVEKPEDEPADTPETAESDSEENPEADSLVADETESADSPKDPTSMFIPRETLNPDILKPESTSAKRLF